VPARGTIDYQYFEVPTNFAEDRWMQAGEVRAGDRAHVHHIIVYVREPQARPRQAVVNIRPILAPGERPRCRRRVPTTAGAGTAAQPAAARSTDNMLVNWAVGEDAPGLCLAWPRRFPAGSTLIFQVHYTTNGTAGRDRSRLGLVFSKEPPVRKFGPARSPTRCSPSRRRGRSPGGSRGQLCRRREGVDDAPAHAPARQGHDLHGRVSRRPEEIVLRVPKFDFGWQTDYWLAQPITLPKGSKLHVTRTSTTRGEQGEPDPTATVRWGDQTWEEMMIGFFTYTVERPKSSGTRALERSPASSR
jgi:hypothetical protein